MIRMSQNFNIQHLPEILTLNYVQSDSMTRNNKKGFDAIKIIYFKLGKLEGMDKSIKASFYNQMGTFAVRANMVASSYFIESFKNKANFKVIVKYIICLLKCDKLLLRRLN